MPTDTNKPLDNNFGAGVVNTGSGPDSTNLKDTLLPPNSTGQTQTSDTTTSTNTNVISDTNVNNSADTDKIITSAHIPESRGGTKVLATIFGIVLLIAGVAAGVYLVEQQQELRERAASGAECSHSTDCILLDSPGNKGSFTAPRQISYLYITAKDYVRFDPPGKNDGCYEVDINGNKLEWERKGDGPNCKDISNIQIWLGGTSLPSATPSPTATLTSTPEPSNSLTPTSGPTTTITPTQTASITASCSSVKAYDSSWNLLSPSDLNDLKPGDVVKFTVSGTTNGGTFDKARFTINNVSSGEVLVKKSGTNEFYYQYIIPSSGTSSFNVKGEVHHSSLGWI